jgi:AhpD family alkylhydroperoxidase
MARGIAGLPVRRTLALVDLKHQNRPPFDGLSNPDCRLTTKAQENYFKFARPAAGPRGGRPGLGRGVKSRQAIAGADVPILRRPPQNLGDAIMPSRQPIEYRDASPRVRAVFDDIKRTREVADVNNFWKYLAHDPATLERTWTSLKEIMAPGAIDALTKEMIYVAVSVTNGCSYCIASHGAAARKAGMSEAMFGELMAVVGMANETNRLANGYRVPIDPAFE